MLQLRVKELEMNLAAYDVLERTNVSLRDRIDQLVNELETENRKHDEQIHKLNADTFHHKVALEKTFRKALSEKNEEYMNKAFLEISKESKVNCVYIDIRELKG